MDVIFYILAVFLIALSFKSFRGGIAYLRFFRTEAAKPRPDFTPFVTVIAPCRGVEPGLGENLTALLAQDFPHYEVLFVVDSENDPSVDVITEVLTTASGGENKNQLIVAPKADGCSQKVANLREAVLHVDDRSEAFAFVDSDARPSADWLRWLVAPLQEDTVGATTGYRWFISKNPTFASELRCAWNASIASALGPNTASNFCWGGSMAIRRDVFERLDIRDKLQGTLSDDFAVTNALRAARMPIVFVPRAMTSSVGECTLREMLEFTTRQMKITRVYAPRLWIMSLVGSALFCTVMLTAALIVVRRSQDDLTVLAAIATLGIVALFSVGKAWLRMVAVKSVLKHNESDLRRQMAAQLTFWMPAQFLFLYNSIAALFSRRLSWRGIVYELKSPTETVIIAD